MAKEDLFLMKITKEQANKDAGYTKKGGNKKKVASAKKPGAKKK